MDIGLGDGAEGGDAPVEQPKGPTLESVVLALDESERRREEDNRRSSKEIASLRAELADLRRQVSGMAHPAASRPLTMLFHPDLAPQGKTFVEGEEPKDGGWVDNPAKMAAPEGK